MRFTVGMACCPAEHEGEESDWGQAATGGEGRVGKLPPQQIGDYLTLALKRVPKVGTLQ